MMRLPLFDLRSPATVAEAATILAGEGPAAMLLAGGTDLLPNMKRRHQVPQTLVALSSIGELQTLEANGQLNLGAGLSLTRIVRSDRVRQLAPALWQAASQVATPHLRNMGTLGGNICLDTRCTYYNQNEEWRQAIGYCMKKEGEVCWVAPASKRCLAVSSTDTAPALIALGAEVQLSSSAGERQVKLEELYLNDGIEYLARRPDEIVTQVRVALDGGWRSCYWKLRRRGSFDFPVLSVAAAVRTTGDGTVEEARLVLGAVASRPISATTAAASLQGKALTDAAIAQAGLLAGRVAKPMDNTDFKLHWRKRVTAEFVTYALRELRGDDVSGERLRIARRSLESSL